VVWLWLPDLEGGAPMQSGIIKRSGVVDGHKTSVSLEDQFWSGLKEIAHAQGSTLSKVISEIDNTRQQGNLSSALRLFVLDQVRIQANTPTARPASDLGSTAHQATAVSA
jgi:predicted DNA-binding ribbon-helix-helix protein